MQDECVRVLLVEDDEDDYLIVRDLLADIEHQAFELEWKRTFEEALEGLAVGEHDVVLTDYRLGTHTGLDLLRELGGANAPAPVIVLTGQGDRVVDLAAMDAGAMDYLGKGEITAPLLERSLRYAIERHQLVQQLRTLSLTDELTGLCNRRGFFVLAEQALRVASRKAQEVVFLFADLDGLKRINDIGGHEEGDRAITEAARVLQETFRRSDVVARIAGDEFAVLAADTPPADGARLMERLKEVLESAGADQERGYTLSMSVGLAVYHPERPQSVDELLREADAAMYEQKHAKTR